MHEKKYAVIETRPGFSRKVTAFEHKADANTFVRQLSGSSLFHPKSRLFVQSM